MTQTITQGYLDRPIFSIVSQAARQMGVRAFVIGGYVRDCFLGTPNDDIDIVVEGSGIALGDLLLKGGKDGIGGDLRMAFQLLQRFLRAVQVIFFDQISHSRVGGPVKLADIQ